MLLEKTQLDVNQPNLLKNTPLHLAARQGHAVIVDILLAAGANPNAKAERGRKPSAMAARRGHVALARRLREAEAATQPPGTRGNKYQVAPDPGPPAGIMGKP